MFLSIISSAAFCLNSIYQHGLCICANFFPFFFSNLFFLLSFIPLQTHFVFTIYEVYQKKIANLPKFYALSLMLLRLVAILNLLEGRKEKFHGLRKRVSLVEQKFKITHQSGKYFQIKYFCFLDFSNCPRNVESIKWNVHRLIID